MKINFNYTPVTITFENSKEWKDFREFLWHTRDRMVDRIQDSWFTRRELSEHEKNVSLIINKILEETKNLGV